MTSILYLVSDLRDYRYLQFLHAILPEWQNHYRLGIIDLGGQAKVSVTHGLIDLGLPVWRAPIAYLADFRGLRLVGKLMHEFQPDVVHTLGGWAAAITGVLCLGSRLYGFAVDTDMKKVSSFCTVEPEQLSYHWLANYYLSRSVSLCPQQQTLPWCIHSQRVSPNRDEFLNAWALPADARLIVAAAGFNDAQTMKTAIWAFDVVKYSCNQVYLLLIGDGPERARMERFAMALGYDDLRIRFLGLRSDIPELFDLAEQVWVTHERGGEEFSLAGSAAGKPIVAYRNPEQTRIIADQLTGLLVPVGDKVALASAANRLLEQQEFAKQLGLSGQYHIMKNFTKEKPAYLLRMVYDQRS